jgi:hypothetical protein
MDSKQFVLGIIGDSQRASSKSFGIYRQFNCSPGGAVSSGLRVIIYY